MTIFKKFILSLAIAPLAISMAFAQGGNDPIGGIDIIIKKPKELQANIKQPATTQERRVIKQQAIGSLTQVNPTKPSINEEGLPYQGLPDHDECTQSRIRYNIICSERQDP